MCEGDLSVYHYAIVYAESYSENRIQKYCSLRKLYGKHCSFFDIFPNFFGFLSILGPAEAQICMSEGHWEWNLMKFLTRNPNPFSEVEPHVHMKSYLHKLWPFLTCFLNFFGFLPFCRPAEGQICVSEGSWEWNPMYFLPRNRNPFSKVELHVHKKSYLHNLGPFLCFFFEFFRIFTFL